MDAIRVDTPHAVNPANWDFHEKRRWLYHYLIMKLNIRLFNATIHIKDKNGFEVLRIMNDELDKIPGNARFQANILLGKCCVDEWPRG